jgi:SAM-dependent methyltransferase
VSEDAPYYRADLARVHHEGFGFHADGTAPGIIAFLEPVRDGDGLVVEFGCGSGLLTRHLVDAGFRVAASDASPAMLALARAHVGDAAALSLLTLPDDPLPEADAIVGVGHALNYLPDGSAIDRAMHAVAEALRPDGLVLFDVCDLAWGAARRDQRSVGWTGEDWALITRFPASSPDRYVREMTIFTREPDGSWRRDDERHDNVLIDTGRIPALFAEHGVEVTLRTAIGAYDLPIGLVAVVGAKRA